MHNIDILLTASCYKSAISAERLINSLHYLDSNTITIITAPLDEDINYLKNCISNNIFLFKTSKDNMYLCRNWGFIWAVNNNITPKYYCSCDDDIEFIEDSKHILERLDINEFSVMTFHNGVQNYPCYGNVDIGTSRVLEWINGDCMFTHLEDNLKYGLPDCLLDGNPMPYHVESEYQQRLYVLTGKPILADIEKIFYIHHWYDDDSKVTLRSYMAGDKVKSGFQFFNAKYHRLSNPLLGHRKNFHEELRERIKERPREAFYSFLYRTHWKDRVDYKKIYNDIKNDYIQIQS